MKQFTVENLTSFEPIEFEIEGKAYKIEHITEEMLYAGPEEHGRQGDVAIAHYAGKQKRDEHKAINEAAIEAARKDGREVAVDLLPIPKVPPMTYPMHRAFSRITGAPLSDFTGVDHRVLLEAYEYFKAETLRQQQGVKNPTSPESKSTD